MTRRRVTLAALAAALLAVVVAHPAGAASDLYGNVGPGAATSGLADRYPLGHYALDQHFSAVKASLTGGVDASGVPAMIAFFLANVIWQITAFAANAVIALFALAFSLDLLNGSEATGGAGALAPVSEAIRGLYASTFGQPWMVAAVALTGSWAMWHALVQRRYTETASALVMSLIYTVVALVVVSHPDQTIGQASRLSNQLSTAFLAVGAHGEPAGGEQARRGAADHLFSLLIHTPWVALNFGGTEHCIRTDTGDRDHDPISLPVRPLSPDPAQDARLRRQLHTAGQITTPRKACVENTSRYPGHFLRYAPGSDDRDAEYQAVNDADPTQLPDSDPGKTDGSYRPAVADKPVTDAMEKGGQDQRLLLSLVILAGELGALLLLGVLSVSVLLSQVIVLLLACFAPVALVAAVVPGRGHEAFKAWAARLASYLVRKAAYSLVLAVILAVLSALQDATSNLGWLMSFGLQALLLWTVYLQRHALTAQLISTVSGHQPERDAQLRRLLGLRHASRVIGPPPAADPGASRQGPETPTTRRCPATSTRVLCRRRSPPSSRRPPTRLPSQRQSLSSIASASRDACRATGPSPSAMRRRHHPRALTTTAATKPVRALRATHERGSPARPTTNPLSQRPPARAPMPTRAPTLSSSPARLSAVTATTGHPPPTRRPRPRSRARPMGPRHHLASHHPPRRRQPSARWPTSCAPIPRGLTANPPPIQPLSRYRGQRTAMADRWKSRTWTARDEWRGRRTTAGVVAAIAGRASGRSARL